MPRFRCVYPGIDTGSLSLINGSALISSTEGQGDAGSVSIRADTIFLNDSTINSSVMTGAVGNGGNISLNAVNLTLSNDSDLLASTDGQGNAGNIGANVQDTILLDNSSILSIVGTKGRGKGGEVSISTGSLFLNNDSQIATSVLGQGNAGSMLLNAREIISINGGGNRDFPSGVFSDVSGRDAIGNAGNINITTKYLQLRNGARIRASTQGKGNAGKTTIHAKDVFLDDASIISNVSQDAIGTGGDINISTHSLTLINGAQLAADSVGGGDDGGGNIQVNATDLVTISGSNSQNGRPSGFFTASLLDKGGDINVNSSLFKVSDGAVLDARTFLGISGNITIVANTVAILNGGQLISTEEFSGYAGKITISASKEVTITGKDSSFANRSKLMPEGISFFSPNSGIFVRSTAKGIAGDIEVNTPKLILDQQGQLNAEAASGNGGNITLNLANLLLMRRGSQISTTAGTTQAGGNGGNITINAPKGFVIGVKDENSDITANAFTGSGGRVNITTQGIFGLQFRSNLTPFSDITASSTFGVNGIVTLNTPNVDPSRGITQLPSNLIDTNRILANSCLVRDAASGGTFIVTGTGGLPVRPGDAPVPVFPTGEVQGVEKAEGPGQGEEGGRIIRGESPIQNLESRITEAQGIYKLPDGQIILSWECPKKEIDQ